MTTELERLNGEGALRLYHAMLVETSNDVDRRTAAWHSARRRARVSNAWATECNEHLLHVLAFVGALAKEHGPNGTSSVYCLCGVPHCTTLSLLDSVRRG